jgi:hypothetical protein
LSDIVWVIVLSHASIGNVFVLIITNYSLVKWYESPLFRSFARTASSWHSQSLDGRFLSLIYAFYDHLYAFKSDSYLIWCDWVTHAKIPYIHDCISPPFVVFLFANENGILVLYSFFIVFLHFRFGFRINALSSPSRDVFYLHRL